MARKSDFLVEYGIALKELYGWAHDEDKFMNFMEGCEDTIDGCNVSWNHNGEAVELAWKRIGGSGRPTLKALRALEQ
jgi:hypothetical protein